jgi:hypothetical protein
VRRRRFGHHGQRRPAHDGEQRRWVTGTAEGKVTSTDPSSGFTGHAAAWFGVADNNQSSVFHFTANAVGTLGNGTPLTIHQEGQFTTNAQGIPVVTRVTVTCS